MRRKTKVEAQCPFVDVRLRVGPRHANPYRTMNASRVVRCAVVDRQHSVSRIPVARDGARQLSGTAYFGDIAEVRIEADRERRASGGSAVVVDVDRFEHAVADRATERQLERILRKPGSTGIATRAGCCEPADPVRRVDETGRVHPWCGSVEQRLVPRQHARIVIKQSLAAAFPDRAVRIGEQDCISVMDEVLAVMRIDILMTWPDARE